MVKRTAGKYAAYATGLFFAAYPFLCRMGEYGAIFALVCVSAVCAATVIRTHKTFRITVADAVAGLAVGWVVAAYWIAARGRIAPNSLCEFAALLLVWFTVRNVQNPERLGAGICLGALLQVGACGVQWAGITPSNHALFPFTGSFANPGPLAGFLAVTLFVYPALWKRKGKIERKIGLYLTLAATTAVLLGSGSRASWLAVCTGAVVCVWPWVVRRYGTGNIFKRTAAGAVWGMAALSLCAGLYLLRPASADGRLMIWKASVSLLSGSPVCGNGPEAFSREYMYHQADYLQDKLLSEEALLADSVVHAFSEPVRIGCEYGVAGLLIFGTLVAVVVAGARKNRSLRFILAGFAAWLVFGLFSYPGGVYPLRLLFIVLTALLAAGTRTLRTIELKCPVYAVTTAGVALLLATATVHYLHARCLEKILSEWRSAENPAVPEHLHRHFRNDPNYLYRYGALLFSAQKYREAIPIFEQAARTAPSPLLLSNLGKCYHHAGEAIAAERCLKTAVHMIPGYVAPVYELFNFYRRENRTAEARQWAGYILSRPFKTTNSALLFARKEAREYLAHIHSAP